MANLFLYDKNITIQNMKTLKNEKLHVVEIWCSTSMKKKSCLSNYYILEIKPDYSETRKKKNR